MSAPDRHAPEPNAIRPCTRVYLLLIGLTLFTWAVGTAGLGGLTLSLLVLGLALLKGHLIGDYFMGLNRVRGLWRWAIVIWLLVPGGLISVAFILTNGG